MNSRKSILKTLFVCLLITFGTLFNATAQEIYAKVSVDYSQIQGTNVSVFKTLETALNEFLNNQNWTNEQYSVEERIDCNFFITIQSQATNTYTASLTLSARRPIYNAALSTTLLNIQDNDLSFTYNEYDQLLFNKNNLTQDLTAVLGFYVYTIIGLDADSFRKYSGDQYFNTAMGIVNSAQSSSNLLSSGWDRLGSNRNRHQLISQLTSPEFRPLRAYSYDFHRKGLDVMAEDVDAGAAVILDGLNSLEELATVSPASYAMLLFFDVKTQEIQSIINEMDTEDEAVIEQRKKLLVTLKKLDPSRISEYQKALK